MASHSLFILEEEDMNHCGNCVSAEVQPTTNEIKCFYLIGQNFKDHEGWVNDKKWNIWGCLSNNSELNTFELLNDISLFI